MLIMSYNSLMKYMKMLDQELWFYTRKGKTNYYQMDVQTMDERLLNEPLSKLQ